MILPFPCILCHWQHSNGKWSLGTGRLSTSALSRGAWPNLTQTHPLASNTHPSGFEDFLCFRDTFHYDARPGYTKQSISKIYRNGWHYNRSPGRKAFTSSLWLLTCSTSAEHRLLFPPGNDTNWHQQSFSCKQIYMIGNSLPHWTTMLAPRLP